MAGRGRLGRTRGPVVVPFFVASVCVCVDVVLLVLYCWCCIVDVVLLMSYVCVGVVDVVLCLTYMLPCHWSS